MKELFSKFLKDESGATMVEYAIMVALIAVIAIAAVTLLGNEIANAFNEVADAINDAGGT